MQIISPHKRFSKTLFKGVFDIVSRHFPDEPLASRKKLALSLIKMAIYNDLPPDSALVSAEYLCFSGWRFMQDKSCRKIIEERVRNV